MIPYAELTFLNSLFLKFPEHKPYNKEIRRYRYAIHWDRRKHLAYAQPYEEIEQAYLQKIVEQMGTGEAQAVLHRLFLTEREARR